MGWFGKEKNKEVKKINKIICPHCKEIIKELIVETIEHEDDYDYNDYKLIGCSKCKTLLKIEE